MSSRRSECHHENRGLNDQSYRPQPHDAMIEGMSRQCVRSTSKLIAKGFFRWLRFGGVRSIASQPVGLLRRTSLCNLVY